jgi:uncharacterized protein (DUF427 family)
MKTTGIIDRAGRIGVEQGGKRVRAYLGGEVVADSRQPRLVWEVPYYPVYYFPVKDVRTNLLVVTATVTHSPSLGDARHFTVKAGGGCSSRTKTDGWRIVASWVRRSPASIPTPNPTHVRYRRPVPGRPTSWCGRPLGGRRDADSS